METGIQALDRTDWSKLHHAYGAATDTPEHLRAILSGENAAKERALEHLWHAVIHQGTVWTCTAPVALVVAGLLADPAMTPDVHLNIVNFLVSVAQAFENTGYSMDELSRLAEYDTSGIDLSDDECMFENEDVANAFYARSILECVKVSPVIMNVMLESVKNADPEVRAVASMGMAALAKQPPFSYNRQSFIDQIVMKARTTSDPDERCAHILALGEMEYDCQEFLADQSKSVQVCAAMVCAQAGNMNGTAILLRAIEGDFLKMDDWFKNRPPQFEMHPRFYIVSAAAMAVPAFEDLAAAACAIARCSDAMTAEYELGAMMGRAFPEKDGKVTTEAQRAFLGAMVQNQSLWDPSNGNNHFMFNAFGLEYDRAKCAKLIHKPGVFTWFSRG